MKEVQQFLIKELRGANKTIVVGASHGPDSMAIIHLLSILKDKLNMKIICAHVDHNVRKESVDEANELENFCKKNDIIFEKMTIDKITDTNFENEARIKRYAFFEEVINKYKASYLITAHHGDDLIETIMMRLVRGSSFKGYAGFSRVTDRGTYKMLRPLINVTKEDILEYNLKYNINFSIDPSNESDKYTRNRYRKYILPFLKREDPCVHDKFLKFSQLILENDAYIDMQMKKVIKDVYFQEVLHLDKLAKLDKVIQDRIINHIISIIYQDDLILIGDAHKDLVNKLIASSKPNSYIYLPNDIKVIKSYNELKFEKKDNQVIDYKIKFDRMVNLPNGRQLKIVDDSNDKSNYICRLNSDDVALPLYVRNKRHGDRIEVKGMTGHKKIKDILINEKIASSEREHWPILVDSKDRIVWLPGLKKSKYDKSKNESYDIIIKYHWNGGNYENKK